MNKKEFIEKYEELLNSGYCECNELNCLDNNSPRKILNIMKEQKEEIERLNNIIDELEKWLKEEIERLMTIEQSNNVIFLIGAYTEVLDKLQELKGVGK